MGGVAISPVPGPTAPAGDNEKEMYINGYFRASAKTKSTPPSDIFSKFIVHPFLFFYMLELA